MDAITFLIIITAVYAVALFFDMFFKSCMHYPYQAFLKNTGLTVKTLRIYWHTTALNRTIVKWGSSCRRILAQSFNVGVIISFILLPAGIFLLLLTLFGSGDNEQKVAQKSNAKFSSPTVELLLPGVNLPIDEIGYYIASLAISQIVHEMGHGLAAVIEDVPITGFGMQIYFCLPVAYTEISTEGLNSIKPFRKLRVLCAGIWHNVILASFTYLILSSMGFVLQPFYNQHQSVMVTEVSPKSPLVGEKGLFVNDIITKINDCEIKDVELWHECLVKSLREKPAYCVSSDFIRLNDESEPIMYSPDGVLQCCDSTNPKMNCFEHVVDINNEDPVEIPAHMCLNIRNTVETSSNYCTNSCDEGFCIKPLLNNVTTILEVSRKNKFSVVYIGHPGDLFSTIKVSSYVPKTRFLSSSIADGITLFLKYVTVFSFGLAVINAIPCYGLDGHRIMQTIINSSLINKIPDRNSREMIAFITTCIFTLLFVVSILKVIWSSLIL